MDSAQTQALRPGARVRIPRGGITITVEITRVHSLSETHTILFGRRVIVAKDVGEYLKRERCYSALVKNVEVL